MAWTKWEIAAGFDFKDIIYEKKYHRELEGGVARVTINRPDKLNSFTNLTQDEMFGAVDDASHDSLILIKFDEVVKSQKSDGTVKSSRCKARKSEGMRRT